MNKLQYNLLGEKEKKYLAISIDIISDFMTSNEEDKNKYKRKLLSNITCFKLQSERKEKIIFPSRNDIQSKGACSTDYRYVRISDRIKNITKINLKNHRFKSKIIINDIADKNKISDILIALHETNHADTNQYNVDTDKYIYSSMHRIKKTKNGKYLFEKKGLYLTEALNELYTNIQFYQRHPEVYKNIKSVDDLIYAPIIPEFKAKESVIGKNYRELIYIIKPLIIACDNDMGVTYNSLAKRNDNTPFLKKQLELNDKKMVKNDLLYAGKYASPEFEKKFDEYCGYPGALLEFKDCLDHIYYNITKHDVIIRKDLNNILRMCDLYKTKKYEEMVKKGYWNNPQKSFNEYRYMNYKMLLLRDIHKYAVVVDTDNIPKMTVKVKKIVKHTEKTGDK